LRGKAKRNDLFYLGGGLWGKLVLEEAGTRSWLKTLNASTGTSWETVLPDSEGKKIFYCWGLLRGDTGAHMGGSKHVRIGRNYYGGGGGGI